MKRIGLALGGGGAKGLAQLPLLEVFEELGIRPHRIAGTSIGAIMGALFAAGRSVREIRELVARSVITPADSLLAALQKTEALRMFALFDPDLSQRGFFKGEKFMHFLQEAIGVEDFAGLTIPLRIVASDFWTSEEVVLESGELLPAIKASMGLPGIFTPVRIGERVLIDGGGVNPLPHDLLTDCDVVVAIDVMGSMPGVSGSLPHLARAVIGTFDVMQNSIIAAKLRLSPPDIYIKPDIAGVDIMDFYQAETIYAQTAPAVDRLRNELVRLAG